MPFDLTMYSVGGTSFKTMYQYVVYTCRNYGGNTAFKWVWTVRHSGPTTGVPGGGAGNDLPSVPSAQIVAGKPVPNYCNQLTPNTQCGAVGNDVYGLAASVTTYPIGRDNKELCNITASENRCCAPWNKIENYWPGSSYVDWICIEGYNLYQRGPATPTSADTGASTGDDLRNKLSLNAGYFNRKFFTFSDIVDTIYKKVTGIDINFQNALEGPSVVTKPIMVLAGTRDFGLTKGLFVYLISVLFRINI